MHSPSSQQPAPHTASPPKFYECTDTTGVSRRLPQGPDVFIVGAQKGGTSALIVLMGLHKQILRTDGLNYKNESTLEAHVYDWDRCKNVAPQMTRFKEPRGWKDVRLGLNGLGKTFRYVRKGYVDDGPTPDTVTDAEVCSIQNRFMRNHYNLSLVEQAAEEGRTLVLVEKTPDYLPYVHIPEWIRRICGDYKPRILVGLRDPITRAWSSYKMAVRMKAPDSKMSFNDIVRAEVEDLRKAGLIGKNVPRFDVFNPAEHGASYFQPPELSLEERNERLTMKLQLTYLYRGMYAQQLRNWMRYFPLGDSMMVISQEYFAQDNVKALNEVYDFIGVTRTDEVPSDGVTSKSRYDTMEPRMLEYLKRLFKPYNDEVAEILGESWRGLWD